MKNPICVAIDTPDIVRAEFLAKSLKGKVGMLKLGMEFFYANGPAGYHQIATHGLPIFLDLKLHDIPNTVAASLTSLLQLDPKPAMINVHATGGAAMIKAAAEAIGDHTDLIAVTILTSLDDSDLSTIGFNENLNTQQHAVNLARTAKDNGATGVVCSPIDVKNIHNACGSNFLTVVPGIRPAKSDTHDQKRIATPKQAFDNGADVVVIGRAITGSKDPGKAAAEIFQSLL